ncbi:MAG: tRNA (adenosine(37)-N6)-dimethylallyltransferase MiaA [Gammaproteobacteria bacterium]|jgi:tRNA dimethylallyltransferase|nr:tRNA (adenosine(37)-N6)-dimethylallyltransferase MiaA [Gammaproteobacteria bacterium]MBT4494016.1 tRNA (adenosine(37)-N6)-dimethylallyltransferase MiaA [Gammaproteobacteria bacterium]MBT7371301.1 tRNA (adenosine(37)-N6)-dimethylallyltransferase MiaA [Gammaproteobacteria bacterium]
MGPTASGKSGLALKLAEHVDIEIVSADSAQVYRGMDIGTAKPGRDIREKVAHHLIDICDPVEPYSAAAFRDDVLAIVPEIIARGRLPVIVGGTMLYLKALKEGIADLPEADSGVREEINQQAAEKGWGDLHRELAEVDPESAARIRPADTQRLQRAIEVYRITGVALSELHRQTAETCPFPLTEIAIMPPDRKVLHREIAQRFHEMLAAGFVEEVAALRDSPEIHADLPAIKAVGYRQIWSYLAGETDKETMIEAALAATRQLAKRQYTWLRSWNGVTLLDFPDADRVLKIADSGTILV